MLDEWISLKDKKQEDFDLCDIMRHDGSIMYGVPVGEIHAEGAESSYQSYKKAHQLNPRRLTDADMVGIALDLLNENDLLHDKKSLKYMLEVIAERRPRPKETS